MPNLALIFNSLYLHLFHRLTSFITKEKKHLEAMYAEEDRAVYGLSIPWDLLETISILPTTLDPVEKLREFICSAKLNAAEHANAKKAIEVYENEKAQRWNEMERERNKDEQIASRTTVICSVPSLCFL